MDDDVKIIRRLLRDLRSDQDSWKDYDDSIVSYLNIPQQKKIAMERNPFADSESVAQLIGIRDHKIIGGVCVLPLEFVADGKVLTTSTGSHTLVAEEYRKTCLGIDLYQTTPKLSSDKICMRVGISHLALKVVTLLRRSVFTFTQFRYVRKSSFVIGENRMRQPLWKIVTVIADVIFMLQRLVVGWWVAIKLAGLKISEVSIDDAAQIDEIVRLVAADRHRFRQNVTAGWLKWVYENDFHDVKKSDKHIYSVHKDGRMVGFFMTRLSSDGMKGRIIEWQLDDLHLKLEPWILLYAAKLLAKKAAIVLLSVDCVDTIRAFQRLGIFRCPSQYAALACTKESPLRKCDGYKEQSNWRLRPGMGDAAFY